MISTLRITWQNSIGIVNSTPSYGYDLNSLFLDIFNDSSLRQLVTIPTCETEWLIYCQKRMLQVPFINGPITPSS